MIKLNLSKPLIHLMYKFVDIEFSGNVAIPDDRMIEYSYALSRVLMNSTVTHNILDVGCVARINVIPQTLCELGYRVNGVDIREFLYEHKYFDFIKGDVSKMVLPNIDIITMVSTLEHIGIHGRYGIDRDNNLADFNVINNLHKYLNPEGLLIMTVPFNIVGRPFGIHRLYDDKRIQELMYGKFNIKEIKYYQLDGDILVDYPQATYKTHLVCLMAVKK